MFSSLATAWRTLTPSAATSGPVPSPPMTAILCVLDMVLRCLLLVLMLNWGFDFNRELCGDVGWVEVRDQRGLRWKLVVSLAELDPPYGKLRGDALREDRCCPARDG